MSISPGHRLIQRLDQTVVGACPWVVHKNKDVFGPDADSFNPDRWLKGDASEMRKYSSPRCIYDV